jgi:universal stress protein E
MTNILIVVDPEETEHSALNRVKEIPPAADVYYKVDYYVDVEPVLAREASKSQMKSHVLETQAWLNELVKPFRELGYSIETEVQVISRLYEDIIKSAREFKADIVFKPLRQHGVLKRAFFSSTDWNLIRLCPTPILMVSDEPNVHGKPVIAAVDVGDEDAAHQELNQVVVEQAMRLAQVLESEVHLVYAYGPAVVNSRAAVGDPLAYQIIRGKYDEEYEAARMLATDHGIDAENVHLREGSPALVLHEYAKDIVAGVTVIGTVARSGASGLFVGNTAESVLERTETDMFVVKGSKFKAPV